ncbi:MAG TPA: hypothetical protein VGJ41_14575, partial [Nocardioides sp.]
LEAHGGKPTRTTDEQPEAEPPAQHAAAIEAVEDVEPVIEAVVEAVRRPDDFSDLMEVAIGKSATPKTAPEPAAEAKPAAAIEPEFTPLDEPEPIRLVAPYPLNVPARSFRYAGEVYDDLADEDTIIHPLDLPKSKVVELSSRRRTAALLAVPLAIAGVLVVVGVASAALLLSSPTTPARLDSVSSGTDGEAGVWALVPGQTLRARGVRSTQPTYSMDASPTPSARPATAPTSATTTASETSSPSPTASDSTTAAH